MTNRQFVIRVYAIIINDRNEILLSDEYFQNTKMTKFPGGGLEFGEGTHECLHREALEEFGQPIQILTHFYTTDFFQKALFYENAQLISIYYTAKFIDSVKFKISEIPFDFNYKAGINQCFRWQSLHVLTIDDVTFPIDKRVVEMLLKHGISAISLVLDGPSN